MRQISPVAYALLFAMSGGCADRLYFVDDVDFDFDFQSFFEEHPNGVSTEGLHGPYIAGSSFTVFLHTPRDGIRMDSWDAVSTDDGVFTVDHLLHVPAGEDSETDYLILNVTTVGEGLADLQIVSDDGDEAAAMFDVRVPDGAELHAAAPLFVPSGEIPTITRTPRLLVGGEATYQVVWTDGGEPLAGHGTLTVAPGGSGIETDTERTWLFEDRDWVHIWGMDLGEQTLTLSSNGIEIETVPVTVVGEEEIDHVDIYGMDERRAEEGQWLAVMAQAWDAQSRPIHGVDYAWTRDGASELGAGDLYRYEYIADNPVLLGADRAGHHAETEIHAGLGFVDSSNNVGCATVGGGSLASAVAAAIVGFARRRRRAVAA